MLRVEGTSAVLRIVEDPALEGRRVRMSMLNAGAAVTINNTAGALRREHGDEAAEAFLQGVLLGAAAARLGRPG